MAISEAAYLQRLWELDICPYCHRVIPEGKRVGSGRRSDGGFCSLECFSRYHVLGFIEKARLIQRRPPADNDH